MHNGSIGSPELSHLLRTSPQQKTSSCRRRELI
jgi:hypothetical protein